MTDEPPVSGAEDDEALIRRYQADPNGESGRAATGVLLGRWHGRVYSWAFRVLREREAALDASQEALTQAYAALIRYQARGRFSAWLFTIVHNRCLSEVRKRPLVRDPELDVDALEGRLPGPVEAYEEREGVGRIEALVERVLDPRERTALWLRVNEGLSMDEITRLLDVDGASGARGLLQTARRKLRAALHEDSGAAGEADA